MEMIRYKLRKKECDTTNKRIECTRDDWQGQYVMHGREMKRNCKTVKKQGDKAYTFIFQLGIDQPLNFLDTALLHATKDKHFATHSDTKNRPGTHYNDSHVIHAKSTRIWTPCFGWAIDGSSRPVVLVSVQHSLPFIDSRRKQCQ